MDYRKGYRNSCNKILTMRYARNIFRGGKVMLDKFPYVVGQPAEIFHNGKWMQGKIVAGYRFRDGIVTIQTNTGERIWCGEARKELYRPVE